MYVVCGWGRGCVGVGGWVDGGVWVWMWVGGRMGKHGRVCVNARRVYNYYQVWAVTFNSSVMLEAKN